MGNYQLNWVKYHKPLITGKEYLSYIGNTNEGTEGSMKKDSNGLQLGFMNTIQPNSSSTLLFIVLTNDVRYIYMLHVKQFLS